MFIMPSSRYKCSKAPVVTICFVAFSSLLWLMLWSKGYPQTVIARFVFSPAHPQPATMVSGLFVYQGLFFVLPTIIFLSIVGRQLEDVFGHLLFFTFIMVCGSHARRCSTFFIVEQPLFAAVALRRLPESSQLFG